MTNDLLNEKFNSLVNHDDRQAVVLMAKFNITIVMTKGLLNAKFDSYYACQAFVLMAKFDSCKVRNVCGWINKPQC